MATEPDKPKPHRKWQFSLRTLLVVLTVLCVFFGWLGWKVHRVNEQKKLVEWVREMGGAVHRYYYQFDEDGKRFRTQEISGVDLADSQVSNLTPLAGLKNLEWLDLNRTQVSEEQVEELRQALPNCFIWWSPPDASP
ncbi:MAG: hypothetical protein IH987_16295 [Planctomycetes bacterium]|nr:hypothetical protein [Planctomycetota bacterium]